MRTCQLPGTIVSLVTLRVLMECRPLLLAKNVLGVHGLDGLGRITVSKALKRAEVADGDTRPGVANLRVQRLRRNLSFGAQLQLREEGGLRLNLSHNGRAQGMRDDGRVRHRRASTYHRKPAARTPSPIIQIVRGINTASVRQPTSPAAAIQRG